MLATEAEVIAKMQEVQAQLDRARAAQATGELKIKLSAASSELESLGGSVPLAQKPVTASVPAAVVDAAPAAPQPAPEQVAAAIPSSDTTVVRVPEPVLQTAPEPVAAAAQVAAEPATTLNAAPEQVAAVERAVRESVVASVPAPESVADAAQVVVSAPEATATAAADAAGGELVTSVVSVAQAMATAAASAAQAAGEAATQAATTLAQTASKLEMGDAAAQATSTLGQAGAAVATQAGAALQAVQGAGLSPTQLAVSAVVVGLVGIAVAVGADKFGSQAPAPDALQLRKELADAEAELAAARTAKSEWLATQQRAPSLDAPWAGAALPSDPELTSIQEDSLRLRKELADAQAQLATARTAKVEWLAKYEQSTTPAPAAAVAAPTPSVVADARAAVAAVMAQAGATAAGQPSWGTKAASPPGAVPAPPAATVWSDTGQALWFAQQEQVSKGGPVLYNSPVDEADDEAEIAAMMAAARATVAKTE